ncbi:hypothetical protein EFU26_07225 [Vibrio cholerae]|nr:hypothetical protein [Vibrio cholerae]
MNLLDATIELLKAPDKRAAPSPFKSVKKLMALSELEISSATMQTPAVFVIEMASDPRPDVRGTGAYLQSVTDTVGIVIIADARNGKHTDFEALRQAARARLFGQPPTPKHEPFWLGKGRLLSVSTGRASWLEHYVTEHTEDQLSY